MYKSLANYYLTNEYELQPKKRSSLSGREKRAAKGKFKSLAFRSLASYDLFLL